MTTNIDTKKVSDFRELHFDSIDDCMSEVERIRVADQSGTLRSSGNWTPGQLMAHLAAWIEFAYDGYPVGPPPLVVRWILRFQLRKLLRQGMPRGVRLPGVKEGTVGIDQMETAAAAERLIAALKRLQEDTQAKYDSPAFGPMSHEDRIALNLRHAELHLGYLRY